MLTYDLTRGPWGKELEICAQCAADIEPEDFDCCANCGCSFHKACLEVHCMECGE